MGLRPYFELWESKVKKKPFECSPIKCGPFEFCQNLWFGGPCWQSTLKKESEVKEKL